MFKAITKTAFVAAAALTSMTAFAAPMVEDIRPLKVEDIRPLKVEDIRPLKVEDIRPLKVEDIRPL